MAYNLIVMSFDGEYKKEGQFDTIDQAWERSNDMGTRWFFYPFHFVTTEKTIVDSGIAGLIGKRIKTVQNIFNKHSKRPDMQGVDCFTFGDSLQV